MKVIGVDLGGTKILAALIEDEKIIKQHSSPTPVGLEQQLVIDAIADTIVQVFDEDVAGIGIGVPGLVDLESNLVFNVVNIPSWGVVPLKQLIEERFNKPVFVNNDANCFAIGEKYFGKAKGYRNFVGITLGTGLGAGIIINNHLYSGNFCGAGEFGMIYYKDQNIEAYTSGQFFKTMSLSGADLAQKATEGNKEALKLFEEFGTHVGRAIANILYSLAPEAIILGGSISRSFCFFEKGMRTVLDHEFEYKKIYESLKIEVTELNNGALGASSLVLDTIADKGKK
jgi:Transcriptional regulator/sugar kinase